MPTYDYQCGKCGFEFEREQRITEDAIKTCPECKSRQAKRLLSAPNFILKGGGWYADGYGSSSGSAIEFERRLGDRVQFGHQEQHLRQEIVSTKEPSSSGGSSSGGIRWKEFQEAVAPRARRAPMPNDRRDRDRSSSMVWASPTPCATKWPRKSRSSLVLAGQRAPQLTVVLVGDDPASKSYIKGKQRALRPHRRGLR